MLLPRTTRPMPIPGPRALLLAATLLAVPATRQPAPYTVTNGHIRSAMQPAIRVDVDTAFRYVGSQRWPLYGVAQAEQHLFVQRSPSGPTRIVWVQFEEYLPTSTARYDYSQDAPLTAFGRELRVSKAVIAMPATEARPESDGAYARRLLREHGVTLPPRVLYERFIYLPDTTRRRELMIIYAEDASALPADLPPAELAARLAEHERRALRSFAVSAP